MDNVVRMDFEERDRQWFVTLVDADGNFRPGEPFPSSEHEHFPKLEQVRRYVAEQGYRATYTPYSRVDATHFKLPVEPA